MKRRGFLRAALGAAVGLCGLARVKARPPLARFVVEFKGHKFYTRADAHAGHILLLKEDGIHRI